MIDFCCKIGVGCITNERTDKVNIKLLNLNELTQINDHEAPNKLIFSHHYFVVYLDVFEKQISAIC